MAENIQPGTIQDQEEVKVQAGRARAALPAADLPDKVHTWPYLVRAEFIAGCVLLLVLMVWSITVDAPMEEPANPTKTPNPSKAPWYFLGLQEMLVYFDPWIAGVLLPSLIIVGLMIIPYVDINPKGNGYYTWSERKFAIATFLVGFIGMWVGMITIGVFFRGPGWNLFMPWDYWDPHKVVPLTNIDLPYRLGIRSEMGAMLFGAVCVLGWLVGIPGAIWQWKKDTPFMRQLGMMRYGIVATLFMIMAGVLVKMALRLSLNIKYILVIPNILNI
jgi:cytochrome b/b6/petD-like protein